jgi:folate-binding protein YgfZ
MSEAFFLLPETRGVLALTGEDRATYLQGLITNDTAKLSAERAIYAAFLTPQGKYLHDFSVAFLKDAAGEERYLLDVEAARRADLLKRLSMYRLRSKIALADASADWAVAILYGVDVLATLGLPAEPGVTKVFGNGVVFTDPRLAALGARAILPRAEAAAWLSNAGLKQGDADAYDRLRLELGVPESGRDLIPDKSILLESGFDELNGVDWQKGCYMGQELTARMKYRALVKKRLLPVTIEGGDVTPGTEITQDGKEAGEMLSSRNGNGLALLRLEAIDNGAALTAGGAVLKPAKPRWLKNP